ncbi:hypothetical protein MMPV_003415 [Pyropia vietnamensis]
MQAIRTAPPPKGQGEAPPLGLRPAVLYFAQFTAFASPGRFLSVFLRAYGLSDAAVGAVLAGPSVLSLGSLILGGLFADAAPSGAVRTILGGNVVSLAFFLTLAVTPLLPPLARLPWVAVAVTGAKVSRAVVNPVIDAYTLRYLAASAAGGDDDDDGGRAVAEAKMRYGVERAAGAVAWAATSLALGAAIDAVGFGVVYVFRVVTTAAVVGLVVWAFNFLEARPLVAEPPPPAAAYGASDATPAEDAAGTAIEVSQADGMATSPSTQAAAASPAPFQSGDALAFAASLLCVPYSAVLLCAVGVLNVGTALVENLAFLFWVGDLHATNTLCGVAVVITIIFEVPLFAISPWLSRHLSAPAMLLTAMVCYCIRVAVYVNISDPRYVLFVEPLHGVTFTLMNLATVAEASRLAPPHLQSTGQAFISVVRTVGTIVGTLGGSAVMQWAGSTVAYGVAGGLVAAAAVAYGCVVWCERREGEVPGTDVAG